MNREKQDLWDEIVRTAALIEGYEPLLTDVASKAMDSELRGEDAERLLEVVSDARILSGLVARLAAARPRIS